MYIAKGNHRVEKRQNPRGGTGELTLHHLMEAPQMLGHGRLASLSVLPAGASLGFHLHKAEAEFFYILRGCAKIFDGAAEYVLHPGDSFYTGEGQGHSVACQGQETLEYFAIILSK